MGPGPRPPAHEGVILAVDILFFGDEADHLPVLHQMARDEGFARQTRRASSPASTPNRLAALFLENR